MNVGGLESYLPSLMIYWWKQKYDIDETKNWTDIARDMCAC